MSEMNTIMIQYFSFSQSAHCFVLFGGSLAGIRYITNLDTLNLIDMILHD